MTLGGGAEPTLSQSLALLRARRPAEAQAILSLLGPAAGRDPRVAARQAYACALRGQIADGVAQASAVVADTSADVPSLTLAGNALTLCHQPALAHAAFQRACALPGCDPTTLFNLATTARFIGRLDEAEAAYGSVIAAAPRAWEAYRGRSEIRRQTPESNHLENLNRILETTNPPPEGQIQLCYALGKEYEDLGRYDHAFACFERGARLRRGRMRYDVDEDVQALRLIEQTFDAAWCGSATAAPDEEGPIFIIGLPRTGSTLLERMLGRHSQIQPLGELQTFGAAMVGVVRGHAARPISGKAAMIAASAAAPPAEIGAAYLAGVSPLRDPRPLFTDKLPINLLYAGLIARALPAARIIHLTRDPLDTCVAIFKTLFDEAYPYSYDLGELGAYYQAYARLMDHWRRLLGPRLIEVGYENLAAAPEPTLRACLAQLDLAWEPACLNPNQADTPVMTASAAQVRAPVHTRSIGVAGHYAGRLGPLVDALASGPG